jgi:hypothetical protein
VSVIDRWVWSIGEMMTGENSEVPQEEPAQVPLCPPQILQGIACDGSRAFAVGGRRVTT